MEFCITPVQLKRKHLPLRPNRGRGALQKTKNAVDSPNQALFPEFGT